MRTTQTLKPVAILILKLMLEIEFIEICVNKLLRVLILINSTYCTLHLSADCNHLYSSLQGLQS